MHRDFPSPTQGSILFLTFLFPASSAPSAAGPSYPPWQIISWSQTTTTEQLLLEFPFHRLQSFGFILY